MTGRVLTFYLQGRLFGLDITMIKEINRNIEYSPVPGAPPHIVGLFNMRGQVVTLLDLSGMMEYLPKVFQGKPTCIILKAPPGDPNYLGFLIDKPGEVIDIQEDWCEPPPASVRQSEGKYLKELVKLNKDLIMVVDSEKILEGIG